MRLVEKKMLSALYGERNYKSGNTEVRDGKVYLHGNHIATKVGYDVFPNLETLTNWPTATTKSRLRALGFNVRQRDGYVYINNELLSVACRKGSDLFYKVEGIYP